MSFIIELHSFMAKQYLRIDTIKLLARNRKQKVKSVTIEVDKVDITGMVQLANIVQLYRYNNANGNFSVHCVCVDSAFLALLLFMCIPLIFSLLQALRAIVS